MKLPAGIVLFNPQPARLRDNIEAVYKEAAGLIVVDNASENQAEIRELLAGYAHVRYIRNVKNYGIAKALNQICEAAEAAGYPFVLTLDQDSVCPVHLLKEYENYLTLERTGILCPQVRDRNCSLNSQTGVLKGRASLNGSSPDRNVTVMSWCITSASLVSIQAWREVNGFDEGMFIDGVDQDFCERIRRKGYRIYRLDTVTLLHEIGAICEKRFLFWRVYVKNHSAFRKYYIARNTVFVARKKRSVRLVALSYLRVIRQFLLVLLYEQGKIKKLAAIVRGAWDGTFLQISSRWKYGKHPHGKAKRQNQP